MTIRAALSLLVASAMLPASGAFAKSSPLPMGKHNGHAPIDVTSDTLQVFQQQNKAVFTGHVVAIQENTRLKADTMTVYYTKPASEKAKEGAPSAGPKTDAGSEKNAIQKIDADGNVFLSTPLETAGGDKGIYDVAHHEIHLNGHVVLTRDKNVLKGDTLTYNFDTGQSVLGGAPTSAQPGSKSQGRVHALFVPADSNAGNKKTK